LCIEGEGENKEDSRSVQLANPDHPSPLRPQGPTYPTAELKSDIPGCTQVDSKGDLSDTEFVSTHSGPRKVDEVERRSLDEGDRSTDVVDQTTTTNPPSLSTAGPSAPVASNVHEHWEPFKQAGICAEQILDVYRDIRIAPTENGESYGIKSGSRVICVGDTNVGSITEDQFYLRLGDAFIVLQMYGDLWASCLKLSLTEPIKPASAAGPIWVTRKKDYVLPSNPKQVRFLPLCSVTLEENFGDYIRRRRNFNTHSASTLALDPCNGQLVAAPRRKQSREAAEIAKHRGYVLIPKWMIQECTKIHTIPDDQLTIPKSDNVRPQYGHVDDPLQQATTPNRSSSGTPEPDMTIGKRLSGFASFAEDKVTDKKGRLFGVTKVRRSQSSVDCDQASENLSVTGQRPSTGVGARSPHRNTSRTTTNVPNPPEALAGPSTQTEIRDFALDSAIPAAADTARSGAAPSGAISSGAPTEVRSGSHPSDTAPSTKSSTLASKKAVTIGKLFSGTGNQVTTRAPAQDVTQDTPIPTTTTGEHQPAQEPGSGIEDTERTTRRRTRLCEFLRKTRANRRTQSDPRA
jgi:hypothetical protein